MPQKRKHIRIVCEEEITTAMGKMKTEVTAAEMSRMLSFLCSPIDWSGLECALFEGAMTHASHPTKLHRHLGWRGKTVTAHRLFFQIFNGDAGDEMVLHTCKSDGACVSPAHLVRGNAQKNADDRIRDDTVGLKLSIQDVHAIRARADRGERHHVIAADYPVSRSMIQKIASRKHFKNV